MTTTLPISVDRETVFQHDGVVYLVDRNYTTSNPFRTSTNLTSWAAFGSYPSIIDFTGIGYGSLVFSAFDKIVSIGSAAEGVIQTTTDGSSWDIIYPLVAYPGGAYSAAVSGATLHVMTQQEIPRKVFSTENLVDWTEHSTNLPYSGSGSRWNLLMHEGVMYALPDGTFSSSNSAQKVHTSTDMETWTEVGGSWGLNVKNYAFISHGGKVYIIGGYNGSSVLNSVYSSSDLTSWASETYSSIWSARQLPSSQSFGGYLNVLGGSVGGTEVWKESSGGSTPPASIAL